MPRISSRTSVAVADVALDDLDVAVGRGPGEVLAAAADEVVEHDHLARLLRDHQVGDVRADHAGAARDQYARPRADSVPKTCPVNGRRRRDLPRPGRARRRVRTGPARPFLDRMCGIVGQLRPAGHPVPHELLARMCAGLEHRGPDSRGIHRDGRVGLGIQRLRVIDLDTGDQPIYNEDRSVVVVLNGEIYNYRELRAELQAARPPLRHAGRHRGDRPPLRGARRRLRPPPARHVRVRAVGPPPPAAAARPRPRRQEAAAVRAARRRPELRVGDARRCCDDREIPREVDPVALDRYLALGYVPTPMTALRGVRKLPPAHTLLRARRRSDARSATGSSTTRDKLDDVSVEELVRADPRRRCATATARADDLRRAARRVPVGRHRLLGGRRRDGARPRPSRCGRSRSASTTSASTSCRTPRAIAQQFGTVHEEFQVRADAVEVVPTLVRHYGEPFADSVGDPELLPGRDDPPPRDGRAQRRRRRRVLRRLHALRRQRAGRRGSTASRRRCAAASPAVGGRLPEGGDGRQRRATASRRLAGTLALDGAGALRPLHVLVRRGASAHALYTPGVRRGARGRRRRDAIAGALGARPPAPSVVDKMLEVDVRTYLRRRPDRRRSTSRRWPTALEARSPFLDHELMELAAIDPGRAEGARAARRSGSCARRCAAGCPTSILDRPKQGFSVPLSELAARRPARLGARGPARPRDARARLLRAATPSRRCSTATRPAPTARPSGSGRC